MLSMTETKTAQRIVVDAAPVTITLAVTPVKSIVAFQVTPESAFVPPSCVVLICVMVPALFLKSAALLKEAPDVLSDFMATTRTSMCVRAFAVKLCV